MQLRAAVAKSDTNSCNRVWQVVVLLTDARVIYLQAQMIYLQARVIYLQA